VAIFFSSKKVLLVNVPFPIIPHSNLKTNFHSAGGAISKKKCLNKNQHCPSLAKQKESKSDRIQTKIKN
jgi:hypothetical protein